jgi:hypothetical protein
MFAELVTDSAVEAAAPDGVTVGGVKVHVAPACIPEQLKVTVELNPFSGVTVIVVPPLCLLVTVCDAGEPATEKSGGKTIV